MEDCSGAGGDLGGGPGEGAGSGLGGGVAGALGGRLGGGAGGRFRATNGFAIGGGGGGSSRNVGGGGIGARGGFGGGIGFGAAGWSRQRLLKLLQRNCYMIIQFDMQGIRFRFRNFLENNSFYSDLSSLPIYM